MNKEFMEAMEKLAMSIHKYVAKRDFREHGMKGSNEGEELMAAAVQLRYQVEQIKKAYGW